MKSSFKFEQIIPNKSQIDSLYELLKNRKFLISHVNLPSYKEHEKFVLDNPYKSWFLILSEDLPVGAFYIKYDNSIGINVKNQNIELIESIIKYIKENFKPELPKASLIPNYFYINIANENESLKEILKKLNIHEIQISYKI